MIPVTAWQKLRFYNQEDFSHPEKLDKSIVNAIDDLTGIIGEKGVVLSDWRLFSADRPGSQHPLGRAIDIYFPGDPLVNLNLIRHSRLFSGIGIYLNEKGATSFHLDTRTDRTVDDPATWGGFISPNQTDSENEPTRQTTYTGLQQVIDVLSKSTTGQAVVVGLAALAFYFLLKR